LQGLKSNLNRLQDEKRRSLIKAKNKGNPFVLTSLKLPLHSIRKENFEKFCP
jgi:hypothetical protein